MTSLPIPDCPDEYILPQIKSYLDQAATEENHLLVIHLMGNHSPYDNRYPDDFKEYSFSKESTIGICAHSFNYKSEINEYLTTIRYNDQILSLTYLNQLRMCDIQDLQCQIHCKAIYY